MNKPVIIDEGNKNGVPFVKLSDIGNFSVFKTFDCGQCFRFDPTSSDYSFEVSGTALGRTVSFAEDKDCLIISGCTADEYASLWERYLSLDTDYDEIDSLVTTVLDEDGCAVMKRAAEVSRGIRLLRQDPWETLCSFIISQNNNIPRIKKIISALCENFGEVTSDGRSLSFPTAKALADAGEEKIFALKTGFRAGYIVDAARKVSEGEIDIGRVMASPTYAEAEAELLKIRGVGPKVAACALLFGFGKTEAYPIDTWMKKVAARHFPTGLDHTKFGKYAGIAQQYLFYMERYVGDNA